MTRYTLIIEDYTNKEQYDEGLIYKQDLTREINTSSRVCIEVDTQFKEFLKQLERPLRKIHPIELY